MSFSTTAFYGGQLLTWLLKILPADLKDPSSPTDIPPCRLAVFLFASLVGFQKKNSLMITAIAGAVNIITTLVARSRS